MGNYLLIRANTQIPKPQKHQTLIIGGELETATKCAEFLWDKMSPNIRIHLIEAKEVEIAKLLENAYGALKVPLDQLYADLIQDAGGNFIRTHQAWSSDSRVDGVHYGHSRGREAGSQDCYSEGHTSSRNIRQEQWY